jgi:hypothetical protein
MNDEKLVFEGNRLKTLALFLGCAMFLGVGILFAQDGDRWAIPIIMISAFGCLILLSMLVPGNYRLTIDSSGVKLKGPFRSMNLAWSDVDGFYVRYFHTGPSTSKLIAIKYSDSYQKRRGTEETIPNHFNKSPEELCAILNSYKQRYTPTPVN